MGIRRQQKGSIILIFILTLPFLILLAMYYMKLSLTSFQVARFDQLHTEAQLAADAGADYAVEQFSKDNSWTGTTGEVTLHSDSKLRTTYTASISGDDTSKTIAVTGNTYWPAGSTTPNRSVRIYVDLRPVTAGSYSVVTGAGGLDMSNSSKIVGGDVLINGTVTLSNNAQIGLSTNPVTVSVAHQSCPNPPDTTYPRVCSDGENGQPITINNQAHIYGTVKANNQTNTAGMSSPGLVAGTVTPQALPTYNRAAQKAAAANNMTGSAASCSGSQSVVWPANTKITGDATLSNSCTVTIKGNVWITGRLRMSNSAKLIVDSTVGATQPVIMVDGQSGATFSNNSQIIQNSSGTGVEVITFYSKAACSPDCTSVTGSDLAASRTVTTINLSNGAAGSSSIFYSYWTQVEVSNGGAIGALIGQTIRLSNNAAITFGSSVDTGNTTWVVKGYRRQ